MRNILVNISLCAVTFFAMGVVGCVGESIDDAKVDGEGLLEREDSACECTISGYYLMAFREGRWQYVRPAQSNRAQASSTNKALKWNLTSERRLYAEERGNLYLDCGDVFTGAKDPPRTCDFRESTKSNLSTTWHCDGQNSGRNANACIYKTNGTQIYVDHALKYCLGYSAGGGNGDGLLRSHEWAKSTVPKGELCDTFQLVKACTSPPGC